VAGVGFAAILHNPRAGEVHAVLRDPGYTDALQRPAESRRRHDLRDSRLLNALALAQQYGFTHFMQLLRIVGAR
jgi:hypothetical protein